MFRGLITEPASVYHAKSSEWMSSHRLNDIRLGREHEAGDKPHYRLGRLVHQYTLEGPEEFYKGTVIGGPHNPRTGEEYGMATKAFDDWAWQVATIGKEACPRREYLHIQKMAQAVWCCPEASPLLENGVPEMVGRTQYCGVKCQIRCDWLTQLDGVNYLVDLKTCRALDSFGLDAVKYHYNYQLAFYQAVLELLTGEEFVVRIIAVDKQDKPRAQVYSVHQSLLEDARRENESVLKTLASEGMYV